MKNKLIFLSIILILAACSPRIISDPVSNGRKVGYDDKVLIIDVDENGPQGCVEYLGEINAKKGDLKRVVYRARLMGGNVVKIISYDSFKAKVYYSEDLSAVSYTHETANLYLLRPEDPVKSFSFDVYLNEYKEWRSVIGNYSLVKLQESGEITLMADKMDTTRFSLNVEKGKDYYILTEAFLDNLQIHYSFYQLDEEKGKRELEKLIPVQDPEHLHSGFEFSLQFGPGARIGNVNNSPSATLRSYLGRSRIGYSYDASVSYFLNEKYGCGLKYVDYHTTKVRINNTTDVISIMFAGPLLCWRSKKAYDKNQYSANLGLGAILYSDYYNDGLGLGAIKATSFGWCLDGAYYRWLTTDFAIGAFVQTVGGLPVKKFGYDDSSKPSYRAERGPESVSFFNAGISAKVSF